MFRPSKSVSLSLIAVAGLAISVPLAYSLFTNHIWEDFFITFRFSRNLCEGKGLVYQPGERVYGFTSPLGMLLPALAHWLAGSESYLRPLWLFRAASIAAFATGCFLLFQTIGEEFRSCRWAPWFVAILYTLDAKSVAYSTNGMETAFMLLFFAWGLYLVQRDDQAGWLSLGICWGGLMWTRPDGWAYITALGLAALFFSHGSRKGLLRSLFRSAGVCALIYLPWFVGTWVYFGSPVPNTVRAKSPADYGEYLLALLESLPQSYYERASTIFSPIYYGVYGGWPSWIGVMSTGLSVFCTVYCLLPIRDRLGRSASLCFAILSLYLLAVSWPYPWYLPPITMCASVVLVSAVGHAAEAFRWHRSIAAGVGCALLCLLSGAMAYMLGATAWQMGVQQQIIENNHRVRIGSWLKSQVAPGERVYVECLGYFGYFSDAHMLDCPGLVSPEVVQLRKTRRLDIAGVIPYLWPEWVVLRPREAQEMLAQPACRMSYGLVKIFDVRADLDRYPYIPGRGYLAVDTVFLVFHKRPALGR